MTQIALLALAVVCAAATAAAGVQARARRHAVRRAEAAATALAHGEDRIRAVEARLARSEDHARDSAARLARSEHEAADVRTRAEALLNEIDLLAAQRLPAAALALSHPGAPVPPVREPDLVGERAARALDAVLEAAAAAVVAERERVDAAARAAMRGTTSKIQTLLYQVQSLVQQVQHDNDDPRLLELDFRNEVALRRIQTVAVLCEAWPGLARADSPLAEVVLGALSRVPGYPRIKVANHLKEARLAVVARAAEPVAVAVAELLANATAYSHPDTEVPVTVQQGGRGALVVIDDSGIGMDDDQLARARRLLAGPPEVLLTELGNPPKAGFAVVGRLARQYGFSCHIEPSPYGGMRTMLRLPAALLTVVDADQPLSVLAPQPVRAVAAPQQPAPAEPSAHAPADTEPGAVSAVPAAEALPSRRRRRPLPAAPDDAADDATREPPADRTPEQAAARWRALQKGTDAGRSAADRSEPAAVPTEGAEQ
ncbi:ATP-binding protein [Kitasatospora sp. NPDC059571]|uniref:ATP-binding protein n=1 Tax=Kitasatospora sp. NPDC059571 TaxID=3346871 RepID=UPI003676A6A7